MTAARRAATLAALDGRADALYVTASPNVRYLTGFRGSNGQVLVAPDTVFFTDGRYTEQSAAEVGELDRHIYTHDQRVHVLRSAVADRGVRRLGFEASHMTVASLHRLSEVLDGVELVPLDGIVEALRARKDAAEIDAIRRAQAVAESCLLDALRTHAGGTEVDLAIAIESRMRAAGAGVAFETIVASGAHAALPHARPRTKSVPEAGVLLIDMGARVDGYCSDMTRTFLRGETGDLAKVHDIVVEALDAACRAVRPGASGADVDAAARQVITDAGYGEAFLHSTGHGIGLEVHEEAGRLAFYATERLQPGMVVTVEPGIYLEGVGGVRVEDLLVVTQDGHENLTTLPRGPKWPS